MPTCCGMNFGSMCGMTKPSGCGAGFSYGICVTPVVLSPGPSRKGTADSFLNGTANILLRNWLPAEYRPPVPVQPLASPPQVELLSATPRHRVRRWFAVVHRRHRPPHPWVPKANHVSLQHRTDCIRYIVVPSQP